MHQPADSAAVDSPTGPAASTDQARSMGHDASTVRLNGIQWLEVFPVLELLSGIGTALRPAKLATAALLVLAVVSVGLVLDAVFDPVEQDLPVAVNEESGSTEPVGVFQTAVRHASSAVQATSEGLLAGRVRSTAEGHGALDGLTQLTIGVPGWLIRHHAGYLVAWLILVLPIVVALLLLLQTLNAQEISRGPDARLKVAWAWSLPRVRRIFLSLSLVAGAGLGLAAVPFVLGLAFNLPVADVLVGVLFPVGLLASLLLAVLLLAFWLSVHLLGPAVVVDDADPFDAIARSVNYACGRPLRLIGYQVVNLLVLMLVYFVTAWLVRWAIAIIESIMQAVSFSDDRLGDEKAAALLPRPIELWSRFPDDVYGGSTAIGATMVLFWVKVLVLLPLVVAVSVYAGQQVRTYLLLRRAADGAWLDESEMPPVEPLTPSGYRPCDLPDPTENTTANESSDGTG